ncbi:hypothetical protein PVK06_047820 [Gossypium arboreum]|uniref:Aminotransferase-like plant mobile domain-containing protein n=1 Tax=Gossypium arboreum TaxID=29729 RepID=A0ABR0ME94_GOSAR|nr:hypothetical protein PVK06_047820 [Gossypium arboreum]
MLIILYRKLCRATKHGVSNMVGCLGLLQPWALYIMPFVAAARHQPYSWPLVNRWATFSGIGVSQTLIIYFQMIKTFVGVKLIYINMMSYSEPNIAAFIPQWVHAKAHVWCTNTLVFNFSTVEWYNTDQVMRQFRCRQFLLVDPQKFVDVHDKTMRWKHKTDWSV